MDYFDVEKTALGEVLAGRSSSARHTLQKLTMEELDRFSDALDRLAVAVDNEALRRRAEKRR